MIKAYYRSRRWLAWAWGGLFILISSLWLQVQLTVAFNIWYGHFYDLLQNAMQYTNQPHKGMDLFFNKLVSFEYTLNGFKGEYSFMEIAFPYIILATFTAWFTRLYGLRWREAITFHYIPRWRSVTQDIEGASQRIQEDCYRWARLVESMGLQVIRALMTLIAFIPILWALSDKVALPYFKDIDGSLVWVSLVASLGGMLVSWFVGTKLPGLEYNNQRVEAAFRKDLVLGEDNKARYAQPENLWTLFLGIRLNYQRLFLHYGYFDCWVTCYDQFMVVAPYLIMGAGLFTGLITLGVMVQVSNAFQRVHGGFALFLHNWTTITELRSIWKRLYEFEHNLNRYSDSADLTI
jgi:peptide/bleomycin uptake transporter